MLGIVVLCLTLISQASCNWGDGNEDILDSNLGFFALNVTCNDARTECEKCFTTYHYGHRYLYVFESIIDPYTLRHTVTSGIQTLIASFIQKEISEPFRACTEVISTVDLELNTVSAGRLCMDNYFTGLAVPAGCGRPIATATLEFHVADAKIHGQQVLYCVPPE